MPEREVFSQSAEQTTEHIFRRMKADLTSHHMKKNQVKGEEKFKCQTRNTFHY